jgi:hypothetical protein
MSFTKYALNISQILQKCKKQFIKPEKIRDLGRWCHPGLPNCNQDIIIKKIDFANNDNSLSSRVQQHAIHVHNQYKRRRTVRVW